MNKKQVIEKLNLKPLLNEGGFINEIYRSETKDENGVSLCGTIYYLLTPDCCSVMHKLSVDEIYYYHDGPVLKMLLVYDDHSETVKIGKDILNGEVPQFCVPAGVYQGSRMSTKGEYTLLSTSMCPAYEASTFEIGTYEELKDRVDDPELLKQLTGEPTSR